MAANPFFSVAFSGLSIHKIQVQRSDLKRVEIQDIPKWIVDWFNSSSAHIYNPQPTGGSWAPGQQNGFELRIFGCEKRVEPSRCSLRRILSSLPETNSEFVETTWHFVCFMWKAVKDAKASSQSRRCRRIFALTTGEGYKVVKKWSDYSFPIRIALRIADPSMLVVESKPLVGRKGASIDTYRKPYQLRAHELETLWRMFTFFQATIKRGSSFYTLEPFREHKRDVSFQVGHGKVQINQDLTFNQMTYILGLFEVIDRGNPTTGVDGEEEVDDPALKYLNNIVRVDAGLVTDLDEAMFRELHKLWERKSTRIDPTLVHRLYRDYIKASSFVLVFRGPKCTFFSAPSFAEILDALRVAFGSEGIKVSDAQHFSRLFEEVSLRFAAKSFPLKDFIECELPYRGGNYFRNDGMWLEVAGEHLMVLQSDFYAVIKDHLIKKGTEGWLEHSWTAKEEWVAFTVDSFLEEHKDFTREEVEACIKVLQGQSFSFVSEAGTVELTALTPCLLKELRKTDRDKVKKSWEDLRGFLGQKRKIKEAVTPESLADFFDDKKDGVEGRGKRVLEELQKKRPVCTALSLAKAAGIELVPFLDEDGMVLRTNFEGVEIKIKKGTASVVLTDHGKLVINELERAKKREEPFNPDNLVGKKQTGAKSKISKISAAAAFRQLKEGLRKSETKSDYWYVVQGPVPEAAPALLGTKKKLLQIFVDHYNAYKKVDIGEENYNRSYGGLKGYLVGDQLFPGRWEYVELFDILRKVGDKLYLYHVKEEFGKKTGDACNQIRDAAHLIRTARADGQYTVFYELYDKAVKSSSKTTFHRSTKKELEKYGREGFVDLFRKTKPGNIIFVYAFVDTHKKEIRLEDEPDPNHRFQAEVTLKDLSLLKSDALGFLDESGKRTVKFLRATKEAFIEETKGHFAAPGEIYDTLSAKNPKFVPMKAKVQILHTHDYLRESYQYEFGFAVCQIDRIGNPALGTMPDGSDKDMATPPKRVPEKFEYEGKEYQRGPTEGSFPAILAQFLGLEGVPSEVITRSVYALFLESTDVKILESKCKDSKKGSLFQRIKLKCSIDTEDPKAVLADYIEQINNGKAFSNLDLLIGAYLSDTPWHIIERDPQSDTPYVLRARKNEKGKRPLVVSIYDDGQYTACTQVRSDALLSGPEGIASEQIKTLMQKPLGLTGIVNSGADCFLSAILQMVLHTGAIDIFTNSEQLIADRDPALISAFRNFGMEYRLCCEQRVPCKSPNIFRKLLKFNEGQQDAFEVLSKLALHYKLEDMEAVFAVTKTVDHENAEAYTPETQGFSQLTEDGALPTEQRNEFPLTLEIPNQAGELSLQDCLDTYLSEEQKAGEEVTFAGRHADQHFKGKITRVEIKPISLPEHLFVVLRRFPSIGEKDNRKIAISEDLQFSVGEQNYRLDAFVSHVNSDSPNHGHYVSYCRHGDGWHKFDDTNVKELEDQEVTAAAQEAYVFSFSKSS